MTRVEHVLWSDNRAPGVAYTAAGVALGLASGAMVRSTTAAVAISAAGRALRSTADDVGTVVASGDLESARTELRSLVGRDPSELDASGIAAAVIESVAENSVDAVVAPVFWGMVAGAPGALAYRAINTMDAMVGHRNERFQNFGTAAARLDDIANYVPARAFATLVVLAAPSRRAKIKDVVLRDAPAHPSPNAGVAECAFAAALDRELGGPLRYGEHVEQRPTLGDGPRPHGVDVQAATHLANKVEWILVALLAGTAVIAHRLSPTS